MSYSWFQTSQTGGQKYSNTSPFSVPWLKFVHGITFNNQWQSIKRAVPFRFTTCAKAEGAAGRSSAPRVPGSTSARSSATTRPRWSATSRRTSSTGMSSSTRRPSRPRRNRPTSAQTVRIGRKTGGNCIFSRVRPFYERAVSNLDPLRYMHGPVYVAHTSFIGGSHTTKNKASVT